MRRVRASFATLVCLAAACQGVRPFSPSRGEVVFADVEAELPGLAEWETMPGMRSLELSEPEEDLVAGDPRVHEVAKILHHRAERLSSGDRVRVARELVRSEREDGMDAILMLALIEQESGYNPRARGPRGSLGLMQVRPFVAEDVAARRGLPWYGPETLHDPEANVRIGVRYFAEMKAMYPENTIALAAYNMGPYRVKRMLERGRVPTPRYVFSVLERYHDMRRAF